MGQWSSLISSCLSMFTSCSNIATAAFRWQCEEKRIINQEFLLVDFSLWIWVNCKLVRGISLWIDLNSLSGNSLVGIISCLIWVFWPCFIKTESENLSDKVLKMKDGFAFLGSIEFACLKFCRILVSYSDCSRCKGLLGDELDLVVLFRTCN